MDVLKEPLVISPRVSNPIPTLLHPEVRDPNIP
jgi:hypothetical protein